jgi:hypothetical protein
VDARRHGACSDPAHLHAIAAELVHRLAIIDRLHQAAASLIGQRAP